MKKTIFDQLILLSLLLIFFSSCGETNKNEREKKILPDIDTTEQRVQNDVNEQLILLSQKIKEQPNNPGFFLSRAKIYQQTGKLDLAINDLKKAVDLNPEKIEYYTVLGDVYWEIASVKAALDAYNTALNLESQNEDVLLKLGEMYFYLQDREKSIQYLNECLRVNKFNTKAYYFKAKNYFEDEFYTPAISNLHTAIEIDPQFYDAYMELGFIAQNLNDKSAVAYFTNAINIKPYITEPYYARAYYYKTVDSIALAISDFEMTLNINPKHRQSNYELGMLYLFMDEYSKSIKHFTNVIEQVPRHEQAYYGRGLAFKFSGDSSKALYDFKTVIAIGRNLAEAAREELEDL